MMVTDMSAIFMSGAALAKPWDESLVVTIVNGRQGAYCAATASVVVRLVLPSPCACGPTPGNISGKKFLAQGASSGVRRRVSTLPLLSYNQTGP